MTTKDKARLTLFVSPEKLKKMKVRAIMEGVSLSELVVMAVEQWVKENKEKPKSK